MKMQPLPEWGMRRVGRAGRGSRSGGRGDAEVPLSAAGFLAELRRGVLADPRTSELRGGRIVRRERASGERALALSALERRFVTALRGGPSPGASAEGAQLARSPLLRAGPYDLVRPDLALLGGRGARVLSELGGAVLSVDPRQVVLVVDAPSDRSDAHDRLQPYARAAVREVWLLDVRAGWTEAYRSPWAGAYRSRTLWYPGEAVPLTGLPGVAVEALGLG